MRFLVVGAIALGMSVPAWSQAIPPAPSLTAGADFKGLQFDWEPVEGATRYELEYKANQNASFVQRGGDLPASATSYRYRFPLHLFDWTYARYRLAACNAAGCSRSGEISVSGLRRDAVGYFKADVSTSYMEFGADTDISPDGRNFVTVATGVDGVYVFQRGSTGDWQQRARLQLPQPVDSIDSDEKMFVRTSADGNTVVVGIPNYLRVYLDEESYDDVSGEVFVFQFNGTSWVRSRLPAGAGGRGGFGNWVSVSDAGDLIALGSGKSTSPSVPRHALIYRNVDGTWKAVRDIKATPDTEYCDHGALSGDGSTLVQTCREGTLFSTVRNYVRTYSGPNWTVREDMPLQIASATRTTLWSIGLAVDGTGDTIAAHIYEDRNPTSSDGPSEVHVFHRDGAYSRVAVLTPGAWRAPRSRAFYGADLAISDDGSTIAVGDRRDNGLGRGPRAAPLNPGTVDSGGVYVYRLRDTWRLANMVKPSSSNPGTALFGGWLALNGNGQTMIIGQKGEASSAQGIGGDWENVGAPGSGAVWMY